jgi:periplasmic divalent cation tolerance protein
MVGELIVLVTCPRQEADKIAKPIVEERLAACVNVVHNVSSTYRWQGKVETDNEDLLVIKSNTGSWQALMERVKQLHTYDTPEIVCVSIEDGYKPYLDWLNSSVGQRE